MIISYDDALNGYVVSMYQVGEPQGTFGDVKAKLVLTDAGGTVIEETILDLANDGGNVRITNITEVNWFEDRVEVKLKALETSAEFTCVLNYN